MLRNVKHSNLGVAYVRQDEGANEHGGRPGGAHEAPELRKRHCLVDDRVLVVKVPYSHLRWVAAR